jgi:hypothetical protein
MGVVYGSAQDWLQRAEDARLAAKGLRDEESRKYMLAVAECCERIAKWRWLRARPYARLR